MGRDGQMACRTCKLNVWLGYTSYSSWLDGARTVAEFDALPDANKSLIANQNVRRFLVEHAGHSFVSYSDDWMYVDSLGRLGSERGDGSMDVAIDGFNTYRHENWDPDD